MIRHFLATCLLIILYTMIMSYLNYYVLFIPTEMSQLGCGIVIGGMGGRLFLKEMENDRS